MSMKIESVAKYFLIPAGTLLIAITLASCHNARNQAAGGLLAEFYTDVKIIDDPMYKQAALNEDSEPGKANDYFNAHQKLRDMMTDQERKAVVIAAFLSKQPTALRPLQFAMTNDLLQVTCALGPTDEKKGVFSLKKSGEAWKIEDFEGAWVKRKTSLEIPGVTGGTKESKDSKESGPAGLK